MADERKDAENVFRALFKREMSPLTAKDIQNFVGYAGTSILMFAERCRINLPPDEIFMLIKRGDEWTFVLGTDARFANQDLAGRSYCTKAWGYFGSPPDFETVRDNTAVYYVKRSALGAVRNADDLFGILLITDPPLLPLTIFISQENKLLDLGGVPHDLSLPEALEFAPEIGDCMVERVGFVYSNAKMGFRFGDSEEYITAVVPFSHSPWPPVWKTMTTADRYYLVEYILKAGAKYSRPHLVDNYFVWHVEMPSGIETWTMGDVERNTAGRTVTALSRIISDRSLTVYVLDPTIPHRTLDEATNKNVVDCTNWYNETRRDSDEFFEPLEAQEIARSHVATAKPLKEEEKVPSRALKPICNDAIDHITRETWDEFELNPADPMEAVVTIFHKPGVYQGSCYRLDYLLQDLRTMRSTAYKWVGNYKFGRPDHRVRYHKLLGLSVWLDEQALDQLELSGSRFFALRKVGTDKLGHRSGSIQAVETDVYTLVPITKETAAEYLAPDGPIPAEASQSGEPMRAKRPRPDESSPSPEAQRTRFAAE